MAQKLPEQSPAYKRGNTIAFVRVVKHYLAKYDWSQKDLAVSSGMSESMISRMFHNVNGKGDTFYLTPEMVMKIAIGVMAGWEGYKQLMEAAFPAYTSALKNHENYCTMTSREEDI